MKHNGHYYKFIRPFKEILIVFKSYAQAFSLLFHKRMYMFLLAPILINIVLFWVGYSFIGSLAQQTTDYLYTFIGAENWNFWGASFFDDFLSIALHITLKVLFFIFMVYYGGIIVIVLMSPILSIISERIEAIQTGEKYPFSLVRMILGILRGIGIALRNGILQLFCLLLITLIGFIPIVGIIAPLLLFIVSSYFYGFTFMDFAMERRYYKVSESTNYVKRHLTATFTIGAIFSISLLLPLVHLFIASCFAIVAVIASTLVLIQLESNLSKIKEIES